MNLLQHKQFAQRAWRFSPKPCLRKTQLSFFAPLTTLAEPSPLLQGLVAFLGLALTLAFNMIFSHFHFALLKSYHFLPWRFHTIFLALTLIDPEARCGISQTDSFAAFLGMENPLTRLIEEFRMVPPIFFTAFC